MEKSIESGKLASSQPSLTKESLHWFNVLLEMNSMRWICSHTFTLSISHTHSLYMGLQTNVMAKLLHFFVAIHIIQKSDVNIPKWEKYITHTHTSPSQNVRIKRCSGAQRENHPCKPVLNTSHLTKWRNFFWAEVKKLIRLMTFLHHNKHYVIDNTLVRC